MKKTRTVSMLLKLVLSITCLCSAQENAILPDLTKIIGKEGWRIANRNASLVKTEENTCIYLDSQPGDGVVWLEGFDFINGTIEVDIKGKDVQGSSFVGIAFRGVDEKTYDAVYFRPFDFLSKDSVRNRHGVQYVSQPVYTWQKLREDSPGQYESRVVNVSDPNSFFHARIVVQKRKISVFADNSNKPCLVVEELSKRSGGWIGLWVGNYSDGTFANLRITKND